MTKVRAVWRILLFMVWTLLLVPVQYGVALWRRGHADRHRQQSPVVRLWYRGVLSILHVRVSLHGNIPPATQQTLFVANHSSYLDIMVLGAHVPAYFVAKADTADWPIFGSLIKIGGTIFISRQRSQVRRQMALFGNALRDGRDLLLFPEGTTSDGLRILPFKSGLLNVLAEPDLCDMPIVPVCITYQALNGVPFTATNNRIVAWYDNMTLLPHLWELFQQRSVTAEINLLPALPANSCADAKQLAARCETLIRKAFDVSRQAVAARDPV